MDTTLESHCASPITEADTDQPFGKFWRTGLSFGYLVFVCTWQQQPRTFGGEVGGLGGGELDEAILWHLLG